MEGVCQKNYTSVLTLVHLSPLINEGLSVCSLQGLWRGEKRWNRNRSKGFEIKLVTEDIVGARRLEIFPFSSLRKLRLLQLMVGRQFREQGRWEGGHARDK